MKTVTLIRLGDAAPIRFAVEELCRYLRRIDPTLIVDQRVAQVYDPDVDGLWIGLCPELNNKVPQVCDPRYDDAICLDVTDYRGFITGANERSVLIGAYRLLKEIGVAFVRPGPQGEILPNTLPQSCRIRLQEKPSYRHRGVCIEGANSYQHVYDMIDWLPKAGMNEYFIQFANPKVFFQRWDEHWLNDTLPTRTLTDDQAKQIERALAEDIAQRGLMHQAVGHGWTCDPLGFETVAWHHLKPEELPELKDEDRMKLALVNGERKFWNNCPMLTEYCYSNPDAVNTLIDYAVSYCKAHPTVTHLHFWLSDGFNNTCECDQCRTKRHADQYIELLNKLDQALTRENIQTKVVFLIYLNLLWPPVEEYIKNSDRFLLMFAPISRSYFDSYKDIDLSNTESLPQWERNKMESPKSVSAYLSIVDKWFEKTGAKDSFDFDYHLWSAHFRDPGYCGISRILHRDVQGLERIGLNGLINCQLQRVSLPNFLPMETAAQTLWNKDCNFEDVQRRYFQNAFGTQYQKALDYLEDLTRLGAPDYALGSKKGEAMPLEERLALLQKAIELTKSFAPTIAQILDSDTTLLPAQALSWKILQYHGVICAYQLQVKQLKLSNANEQELETLHKEAQDYIKSVEPQIHPYVDVWHLMREL